MKTEASVTDRELMLDWIDERFIRSFAKVHCLALIANGHKHGYDIMKHIEEEYGIKVSAGSYYPLLQWLEDNGYIEGIWEHSEGKPGKKVYAITAAGIRVLDAARKRILDLAGGLEAKTRL